MRKDVKIAFVVGGILIAVLVVYVMVVPAGQKNPANKAVTLDTGPQQTTGQTTPPTADTTPTIGTLPVADSSTKTPETTTDAVAPTTKPADPFASSVDNTNGDKWMLALNRGTVPMMTTSAPKLITEPVSPKPQITAIRSTSTPPAESTTPPATQPAAETSPAPTATAGRTHLVQKGETIAQIAQAAYGSQNYWPYIIRANPGIVAEKIRPGMTINLPDESEVKGTTASSSSGNATPAGAEIKPDTTSAPVDGTSEYEVQSGDSLAKISMKLYGNSAKWQAIYDLNKDQIGSDPAKVKVKTILKLPEPPTVK